MERGLGGIVLTSVVFWLGTTTDVGPFVMTRENLGQRNYKCPRNDYVNDPTAKNNFHFRGAALGGWLVLEPWITPSLFYQFLGANERYGDEAPSKVGMDSSSFCTALGDEEANKQLRRHWKTWVTEKEIRDLKASGIDTLRIPVGDWMYIPYEPYIGCMDGAMDELNRVLSLCTKHGLKALLDIHAAKGSQNGLDNSGVTDHIEWISPTVFRHWDLRSADWVGHWNMTNQYYDAINFTNIDRSLQVIQSLVHTHKDDKVVIGLTPINEPWYNTPMDILQEFYWQSYRIVQANKPDWITLMHDSFRLRLDVWGNFMTDCTNYALDTHIYQAWAWPSDLWYFAERACEDGNGVRAMEANGIPIVVGEWSLATDNCALWLNGFNDNVPGYPKVTCDMVKCPDPYMGKDQPNAPPNPLKGKQDPFGSSGDSYVEYGMCPRDKSFPQGSDTGYASENEAMTILARAKIHAFDVGTHGQFFWNFRTEFEPRWSYLEAVRLNWLPKFQAMGAQALIDSGCPPRSLPPVGYILLGVNLTQLLNNTNVIIIAILILILNVTFGIFLLCRRGGYLYMGDTWCSWCVSQGYRDINTSGGNDDTSKFEGSNIVGSSGGGQRLPTNVGTNIGTTSGGYQSNPRFELVPVSVQTHHQG